MNTLPYVYDGKPAVGSDMLAQEHTTIYSTFWNQVKKILNVAVSGIT